MAAPQSTKTEQTPKTKPTRWIGIVAKDTSNEIGVSVCRAGVSRMYVMLQNDGQPIAVLSFEEARQLATLLGRATEEF